MLYTELGINFHNYREIALRQPYRIFHSIYLSLQVCFYQVIRAKVWAFLGVGTFVPEPPFPFRSTPIGYGTQFPGVLHSHDREGFPVIMPAIPTRVRHNDTPLDIPHRYGGGVG